MNYNTDLTKKNQIIIASYALFFIIYISSVAFQLFSYNHLYVISSIIFSAFIILLQYAKASPKLIQLCIIISLNVLILLLIAKTSHILSISWLIFYLILISLYYSMRIIIIGSVIVSIEMILLTIFNFELNENLNELKSLIALGLALIFVGISHTYFVYQKLKQEEKIKQQEIQKTLSKQAYLQLFFEYANDAIAVFSLENKIITVNPAFEKLYGWTKEECIGKFIPLVPPELMQETDNRFKELLKGNSFSIESVEMKKDGTTFHAQLSLSPIFNPEGKVLAASVISRDISYRKENERLQMQSEKLKLAGEIAAGVAHEIRNPLTVISSFVQMMQMDKNSPYGQYVNMVQEEIERINLIISEFLILSKPQVDHKEWLDLVSLIQTISSLYEIQFHGKSIEFEFETNVDKAPFYGNTNQLKQVLINLIKNSIEAIQHEGKIKIVLVQKEKLYTITLQDNGSGISDEHLEHIFEPFYTTKSKGTGLGMMITNKIIQDHGGTIKVFSKEKVGTDIHLHLPQQATPEDF